MHLLFDVQYVMHVLIFHQVVAFCRSSSADRKDEWDQIEYDNNDRNALL